MKSYRSRTISFVAKCFVLSFGFTTVCIAADNQIAPNTDKAVVGGKRVSGLNSVLEKQTSAKTDSKGLVADAKRVLNKKNKQAQAQMFIVDGKTSMFIATDRNSALQAAALAPKQEVKADSQAIKAMTSGLKQKAQ